jgi:catechol 2,3-dioxygenase-like lactoylglutathione lyase family enzyme
MHVDHIGLWVEDPLKSVAFFAEVLNLEPLRVDDYKAKRTLFPSVRLGADSILDLFPKAKARRIGDFVGAPGSAGHVTNHVCLAMTKAEFDTLAQRLEARGTPPTKWVDNTFGARGHAPRAFYFTDLDGNVFEARYYVA